MQKGVKKSKRWCRASSSWDVPIEEKFHQEEDENKRVYFPEIKMLKNDFQYLNTAASRHGVSNSCELETIFTRVFTYGMLKYNVVILGAKGKRQIQMPRCKGELVRKRRFLIHPSFLRMAKREANHRKISLSVLIYKIFLIYRQRFPIHLISTTI